MINENHFLQIAHPDVKDDWGVLMDSEMYKNYTETELLQEILNLKWQIKTLQKQLFGHLPSLNQQNY